MFAKLYETDLGQILVRLDKNEEDDAPEIKIFFDPNIEMLGICGVTLGFEDSDEGYENREKAFNNFTEVHAYKIVSEAMGTILPAFSN